VQSYKIFQKQQVAILTVSKSCWKLIEENCEKLSGPAAFGKYLKWVLAAFVNSFVSASGF
jgi:hypothetical protein